MVFVSSSFVVVVMLIDIHRPTVPLVGLCTSKVSCLSEFVLSGLHSFGFSGDRRSKGHLRGSQVFRLATTVWEIVGVPSTGVCVSRTTFELVETN